MHYVFINVVMFVSVAVDEGCNVLISYVLTFIDVFSYVRFVRVNLSQGTVQKLVRAKEELELTELEVADSK